MIGSDLHNYENSKEQEKQFGKPNVCGGHDIYLVNPHRNVASI